MIKVDSIYKPKDIERLGGFIYVSVEKFTYNSYGEKTACLRVLSSDFATGWQVGNTIVFNLQNFEEAYEEWDPICLECGGCRPKLGRIVDDKITYKYGLRCWSCKYE